jgi:carbonic anhydrase
MLIASTHIGFAHSEGCACCMPAGHVRGIGRRGLLGLAAAAFAAPLFIPPARAEDGTAFEAMLLTCIDPRLVMPVNAWMESRGLKGQYSQFAIAGAAVGVVAPAFATWHAAFWDNLAASIQLHKITRVIVVDHRDCGAAAIAYGVDAIATPDAELNLHKMVYGQFKTELAKRQPAMHAEGGLMALDGSIEMFT